jgi:uncharacterized membrane protein YkvA (DUF1232 family)
MEHFWGFMKLVVIVGAVLFGLFLVLLSLPGSRLRGFFLKVFLFATSGLSLIYIVSPIDAIPDFIPGLGWLDDVFAFITALVSAAGLLIMYLRRLHSAVAQEEENKEHFDVAMRELAHSAYYKLLSGKENTLTMDEVAAMRHLGVSPEGGIMGRLFGVKPTTLAKRLGRVLGY